MPDSTNLRHTSIGYSVHGAQLVLVPFEAGRTRTMSERILVIEDDPEMVELLRGCSAEIGCEIDCERDGRAGLERALRGEYRVVIVDVNLPSLGGFEVCRQLRAEKLALPILMLTSRADEIDKVLGLELGADDYVTKPFSVRELVARIKALVRRADMNRATQQSSTARMRFGELEIDLTRRRVFRGTDRIDLTAVEFDLLVFLALHPGRPFSREELMREVWGYQSSGFEPTVTMHLSRLRAKVEPDPTNPTFILTVRGVGYRFVESEELAA